MKKQTIPYAQTGYFSQTVLHYLANEPQLQHFYRHPFSLDAFEKVVQVATRQNYPRTELVAALHRHYNGFSLLPAVSANLEALEQPNTFAVVTGHQPCLFTGPLYFIYKIVSAINLARQLNTAYPQRHFVPVYWMGADDHDFEEINHVHLFGKTLAWQQPKRTATGRLHTHTVAPVIEELKTLAGNTENSQYLLQLFTQAYLQHDTLAQATRYIVNEWFGQYGLVVVNQDDAQLKQLFAPIAHAELFEAKSYNLVQETNKQLSGFGYVNQAYARPVNLFYLTDDFRERIVRNNLGNGFDVLNTQLHFSDAQIENELKQHPERFSPNVILRPVYQQLVLPSVAYIGGGGELAYWLQLQSVFELYGVNYPMLVLRNSVLWIDSPVWNKMKQLSLQPHALFTTPDALVNAYVAKNSGHVLNFAQPKQQIEQIFDHILQQAVAIDPTLQASVLAETAKMKSSFEVLEAKILRAEKRKFEISVQQIRNIMGRLFPNGTLQERYDNVIAYYLQYGDLFIDTLLKTLDPMEKQFTILYSGA
ncbi:bacillithiol biosynthesis cysteine-adding enzyme BshC [Sphingobacteriales bacterium UPWRP_1]|nr:bacillithiol biosynthesis cysteine-adding enzyme BshC [Sphingobacteriales bacterium TSM_CSS]PSJ73651.1 bacillithiol biosynthesis cysteine-adding enzyme BshC [Sphingobacteriales bacterium UPWRP_1]